MIPIQNQIASIVEQMNADAEEILRVLMDHRASLIDGERARLSQLSKVRELQAEEDRILTAYHADLIKQLDEAIARFKGENLVTKEPGVVTKLAVVTATATALKGGEDV